MKESLARNAVFNVLYKFLSVIFPLIAVSYASRILGAYGIGLVSSAQNLVTYFTMIAALGIPSYGVRAIAQNKLDNKLCNRTFSELFIINFVSTILCFICYLFFVIFILNSYNITINLVFSSLILLNIFNLEWVYQGFEEYKYIAIRSFLVKVFSFIFLIITLKDSNNYILYALFLCLGNAGNYILNLFNLKKHVRFVKDNLNCKKHLKQIFIFFGSVLAIEIYSLLDITMLSRMSNTESVGYYSNASKIVKTIANSITAIGAVLLPRLSLLYSSENTKEINSIINRFFNTTILLTIPAVIGIFLIAKNIVFIMFGTGFYEAITTLKILSVLIVLMPLSGGIFGQLLLTSSNEKKYFCCVSLGTISNAIFNYFLIIKFNQNGAAIASVITEFIVSISMLIICIHDLKISIDLSNFFQVIIATIIMGGVVYAISLILNNNNLILNLVIQISCAIVVYLFVLLCQKNEMVFSIIRKVCKKYEKRIKEKN